MCPYRDALMEVVAHEYLPNILQPQHALHVLHTLPTLSQRHLHNTARHRREHHSHYGYYCTYRLVIPYLWTVLEPVPAHE